jgi:AraC family transcriptional regulator, transcriptional activator of pobA
MNNKLSSIIPGIEMKDFHLKDSHLLVMSLEEYLIRYREIASNPHRLYFHQIVLLMEGEGSLHIDSGKNKMLPGSLIASSAGQVEYFESCKDVNGFIVIFSEKYINKYPEDLKWINSLSLFNQTETPQIMNLNDTECIELMLFIKKMEIELKRENDFAREEILYSLLKTTVLTAERFNRIRLNESVKGEGELNYYIEFRNKMEEELGKSRSVKFYADSMNITTKKLNRVANNFGGRAAKRLIEERVLLETKRLLIHTDKTIKEIGHSLGFNDPTNFNKFFKRYVKITPAEFRISGR